MIIPFGKRTLFSTHQGRTTHHVGEPETFQSSVLVAKYLALTELQEGRSSPSAAYERDREVLFKSIIRGIRQHKILMAYIPDDATIFSLPPVGHINHAEALFYWCVQLAETIPHVLEAYARNGNGVSAHLIGRTIRKIKFEDAANQTDSFFSRTAFKDTDPESLA